MIQVIDNNVFVLSTDRTTYAFRLLPTGQPEHLCYGGRMKIDADTAEVLADRHAFAPGNTVLYDAEHPEYSLEDMRLEASFYGKGDIREPLAEIVYSDGSFTMRMFTTSIFSSFLFLPISEPLHIDRQDHAILKLINKLPELIQTLLSINRYNYLILLRFYHLHSSWSPSSPASDPCLLS